MRGLLRKALASNATLPPFNHRLKAPVLPEAGMQRTDFNSTLPNVRNNDANMQVAILAVNPGAITIILPWLGKGLD